MNNESWEWNRALLNSSSNSLKGYINIVLPRLKILDGERNDYVEK